MRSKIHLFHICIKHKYTDSKISTKVPTQFSKKKLILRAKKTVNSKVNDSALTSNHTASTDDSCDKNNKNFLDSLSSSSKERNSNYYLNVPDIPINLEQAFLSPFTTLEFSQSQKRSDEDNSQKDVQKVDEKQSLNENNNDDINNFTRFNEINMQMLSKPLHDHLFGKDEKREHLSQEAIKDIKKNLNKYGINTENVKPIPDVDIDLPPLKGKDLEEHFYNIAMEQIAPYKRIIRKIITKLPEMPTNWLLQQGWTRYTSDGAKSVDYPLENGMILDVEVCIKEGQLPTLATAVTEKAWYGWVSPALAGSLKANYDKKFFSPNMLIPVESTESEHGMKLNSFHKKPKIIIGHNVSYDRTRIKEQYWLNSTGTRFVDTMSLHICISGLSSYQRSVLKGEKQSGHNEKWMNYTSTNSLSEVHKLYVGEKIDKEQRNVFVEGSLDDVRNQFNDLISYCASDVVATHNVFCKLFPIFEERFPHPVTFAGMLELGCAYLPMNSNWLRYIEEAESTYEDFNYESKIILTKRADAVCKLMHNEKYKEDLWMWDQDWSTQNIKMKTALTKKKLQEIEEKINSNTETKCITSESYLTDDEEEEDPLQKEFSVLEKTKYLLQAKLPHKAGYPAWYRKLCPKRNEKNWEPGPQNLSISMQVTPKLLNLTWENYPLHYIKEQGWGILVPYNDNPDVETKLPFKQLLLQCPLNKSNANKNSVDNTMLELDKEVEKDLHKVEFWRYRKNQNEVDFNEEYNGTALWCNVILDDCCYFFKLPHKDGSTFNVGNPLAKDFLNKFSDNVLAGSDSSATQILKIARKLSYWRNNRDRILSQMVVWFEKHSLPNSFKKNNYNMEYGAIIPQVVVCGTLTRRAVEPTWMTASNAHIERVGSELRSMIQAPPGYNIVGADVDSQELWIASVIGDAYYKKVQGATPFGWMTLIGTKSDETDMHSVTAKAVGISRDHAKIINYARIYGAGQKFAERLLKQFNPAMPESEAISKSKKMFSLTKGNKIYTLKPEYINEDFEDKPYAPYEAYKLAKLYQKPLKEMFNKSKWVGGSESAMFNRLEEIACSSNPVTPFLNCRLTRALEYHDCEEEKYLPTKINWVVQSGAVDFLHLMLVSMRWLMQDNIRFCLSFHDEIRYLVPSRYKYNAALAMHVTNLMTRSFCALRLGMKDLPMSVAFFAAVEVDTVLRKESSVDCKTPSNPYGLQSGYGIPLGESLDIWEALKKSDGSLGSWHKAKSDKKKANSNKKEDDA